MVVEHDMVGWGGGGGLQGDLVLFGAREAGCFREVAA